MQELSNYAKQQILRQETQSRFPYLIEINHIDDSGTENVYRFVNSNEDMEYNGNIYSASYFEIQLPERKTDGFGNAKLTISAVDQVWITKIRTTSKRAKIKFIAVIQYEKNGDTSIEPIEEIEMTLTQAQWNNSVIQWTMIFDDLLEISMPMEVITSNICPALA